MLPSNVHSYDTIIVLFSGGKDSIATFLELLEAGVDKRKIELWHHDVDGNGPTFMDWECTPAYCRAFAEAFNVPIYFSYKKGGFLTEMLRNESLTQQTVFETPTGVKETGGISGNKSTRMQFPQVGRDIKTRWCSGYLKIDIGDTAIRNQSRFNNSRTLVLSGERGEESSARAKYEVFEKDRTDNRNGRSKRHVDHARPVRDKTEAEIWELIEKYKIRLHPAYYLGWGRVSCKFCIFGNEDQFASAFHISPSIGYQLVNYELLFGKTLKRSVSLLDLIEQGTVYKSITSKLIEIALSTEYTLPIIMEEKWILPAGAFSKSCGPT